VKNTIAISAETIPMICVREIFSFRISQARITVLPGYNELNTAETSSLPAWLARMKNKFPLTSKTALVNTTAQAVRGTTNELRRAITMNKMINVPAVREMIIGAKIKSDPNEAR